MKSPAATSWIETSSGIGVISLRQDMDAAFEGARGTGTDGVGLLRFHPHAVLHDKV